MRIKKDTQKELNKLVPKALEAWGDTAQVTMAAEECVELAHACLKLLRVRGDGVAKRKNVIEEIADVLMMINQLVYMLSIDDAELDAALSYKIVRLRGRLEEYLP